VLAVGEQRAVEGSALRRLARIYGLDRARRPNANAKNA